MGGDKTFGTCNLKGPCNEKCLSAPVLTPDKFGVTTSLRNVIELFSDNALFNIKTNGNTFKTAGRNRSPSQCIDDIDALETAPVHLFRFRYIHRLLHPLQPLS